MKDKITLSKLVKTEPPGIKRVTDVNATGIATVKKMTFTLNDVSVVVRELSRMLYNFQKHNLRYDQMLIAMPNPLRQAIQWYMSGQTMGEIDRFRDVKIVPAYENKVVIFTPDWQFDEIEPVFLELDNPALYE